MEEIVASLRNDILKVKELAKIDKIKKVSLFVAPKWKWDALVIVKEVCKDKPDFSATMKALMSIDEFKNMVVRFNHSSKLRLIVWRILGI